MKIIQLKAENIKRIKAVEIKPQSNMVILEGKNAQGKTSVMDCIAYALGGKKLLPENPVRHGEEKASIQIDIGDYKITRNWTKSGNSSLKLENKEGMRAQAPQKMLDGLIGELSFDPMEFCNKSKTDRVNILKDVAKVNLDDLEKEYKEKYSERTFINRNLKEHKAKVEQFTGIEDPGEIKGLQEIQKERADAQKFNNDFKAAQHYLRDRKSKAVDVAKEIADTIYHLDKLKNQQIDLTAEINKYEEEQSGVELADLTSFDDQISALMQKQTEKKDWETKQRALKEYQEVEGQVCSINDRLEEITTEKEQRLTNAEMPIPGLDFKNGDVSFEGVEFAEISMSQKIRVSMAMAMAINPKIKIIRILNGSLLDAEAMAEVEAIAKEKDFQVWLERVSDSKSGTAIYIEDGEIK